MIILVIIPIVFPMKSPAALSYTHHYPKPMCRRKRLLPINTRAFTMVKYFSLGIVRTASALAITNVYTIPLIPMTPNRTI